ncbi:MAG TPA: hypothetical protein DDW23_06580 [Planctomycetes bacterium]|nr:hypothetical protein [Planctomycetota bacterium]|tara:strand:- start:159 stop:839 length:681 start_codon:yes stop_codon:yes gene_type:complete
MAEYKAVTFDCFGTLIDWKGGQTRVLRQLPSLAEATTNDIKRVIELRGKIETEIETGPWMRYSQILEKSINNAVLQVLDLELTASESRAFSAGQLGWPPFPDSVLALEELVKGKIQIGLLSNCDKSVLERTSRGKLKIPNALLISSEELQSYKPAPAHWGATLAALQCAPHEILHVSFSSFHDLEPASELGFSLGFVARYEEEAPSHLTLSAEAGDLRTLVENILA